MLAMEKQTPKRSLRGSVFSSKLVKTITRTGSYGLSLEIVDRLLGHTNPTTTKRYAQIADSPLRAAAERFGAKLDALHKGRKAEIFPLKLQR
jgi:site-specific recombinase XerD